MTSPALAKQTDYGRFYVHPHNRSEVPSITNIIDVKDKPGLKSWAARLCAEYAADNVEVLGKISDRKARIDLVRGAPYRSSDGSSEVGDVVHGWIDRHGRGEEIPDDELQQPYLIKNDRRIDMTRSQGRTARNMWRQFLGIEKRYAMKWIMTEVTVWSETHDYAGTLDWIADIGGRCILGDTKTGNRVYPEVGLQVSAAANADYGFSPDGQVIELPKFDGFAVLHVRPTYARLSPLNIDKAYPAFLGLRECHRWMCESEDSVIEFAPKIETKV